ncbi:hypothetical protein [Hyphobacterium sp.]|uniref:hypothetical protein n=1 Tax=Hyphobacterium sp. TaxID=2004662 RepID=UPI003747B470
MVDSARGQLELAMKLAGAFVDCVSGPAVATPDDIVRLCRLTDELSLSAQLLPFPIIEDDDREMPRPADLSLPEIEKRFALLTEFAVIPDEDPWSDMQHIGLDLLCVLRTHENGTACDAQWEFKFGFLTHWGIHLIDLRKPLLRATRTYTT